MNFENYLFRCSQLGKLMTEPKSKSEILSETTKTYLNELFIEETFFRRKDIYNKYMEKGNVCEQDSIRMLIKLRGNFIKKNQMRHSNNFIVGTPDLIHSDEVEDIKNSWDLFTFMKADVTKDYDWQLNGYCDLLGYSKKRLTYTLVNGLPKHIDDERRKLSYAGLSDETFKKKCVQIERNFIFDMQTFRNEYPDFQLMTDLSEWNFDIDYKKRIKSFELEPFTNELREKLYTRISECRKYLVNLQKQFNN